MKVKPQVIARIREWPSKYALSPWEGSMNTLFTRICALTADVPRAVITTSKSMGKRLKMQFGIIDMLPPSRRWWQGDCVFTTRRLTALWMASRRKSEFALTVIKSKSFPT